MISSPHLLCKCQLRGPVKETACYQLRLREHWPSHDFLLTWVCVCHRELREKIQPEILELIKQQRLNRLCEGSSFRKIGNRRRQGKGQLGHWDPAWDACLGGAPLPSTVHASPACHPVFQSGFGTAAWH